MIKPPDGFDLVGSASTSPTLTRAPASIAPKPPEGFSLVRGGTPPAAAAPASPGFTGALKRGFQRALPETKALLYGAAAAAGGAVGADSLRDFGLENYRRVQQQEVEPLQGNASFTDAVTGNGGVAEWAGDTLGNFGGQALQSLAAGAAGAAISGGAGSVVPGAGNVIGGIAGGVGGVLARGAVKKGIESQVEKLVAGQLTRGAITEAGRDAATAAARQRLTRQLGGAAIAGTGLNVGQEVGIGYTGRADDAQKSGEQLTQTDALRAIGFGVPAGLIDTLAEGTLAHRLTRGISADPRLVRRVAKAAGAGAVTEGATEGVQAVLERAGAKKDLTSPEAITDYIENTAAGALGGSVAGAPAGLRRRAVPFPDAAPGSISDAANVAPPVATPQPAAPQGQSPAATGAPSTPRTPADYGPIQAGYTPHTTPSWAGTGKAPTIGAIADAIGQELQANTQNGTTFPGVATIASAWGLPVKAVDAAFAKATRQQGGQQGDMIAPIAGPDAESARVVRPVVPPVSVPWINTETGEAVQPVGEQLMQAMNEQIRAQRAVGAGDRISSGELAKAWGVEASKIKQAHKAALQYSSAARRVGQPDPLAPLGQSNVTTQPNGTTPVAGGPLERAAATASPASGAPSSAEPVASGPSATREAPVSQPTGTDTDGVDWLALAARYGADEFDRESARPALDRNRLGEGAGSDALLAPAASQSEAGPDASLGGLSNVDSAGNPDSNGGVQPPAGAVTAGMEGIPGPDAAAVDVGTLPESDAPRSGAAQPQSAAAPQPVAETSGKVAAGPAPPEGFTEVAPPRAAATGAVMGRVSRTASKDGPLVQYTDRNGKSVLVSRADIEGDALSLPRYNTFGTKMKGLEAQVLRSDLRAAPAGIDGSPPADVPSQYEPASPAAVAQPAPVATPEPASAAPESPIEAAAAQAAPSPENDRPEPTPAQKEAGNYAKGHLKLHGLDISIENPSGTSRRPEWPALKNHYGYIRRTEGADGDHVDVFIGDNAADEKLPVFVIDQYDPKTKKFDEHKVILGAKSGREARAMYQANYAKNWKGFGGITQMTLDQFKAWLQGDTTKPLAPAKADMGNPISPKPAPAPAKKGAVSKARMKEIIAEEAKAWGAAAPSVEILDTAENLPPEAKQSRNYGMAYGYYDGKRVFLIAENLASEAAVREVIAHEAVGHYGVDRIVDEAVPGGWDQITANIIRLRSKKLGSPQMRSVLDEVSKRYPNVDKRTYAREVIAVMAERGIRNGILDRVIAAVRRWIRKINPNFKAVSESELRALLSRSDKYLRSAPAGTAREPGAFSADSRENDDYAGEHQAPMSDSGSPGHDLVSGGAYPEDVYSANGMRYYGTGSDMDAEAYRVIRFMRGKPNALLTIYRAVPKGATSPIKTGDWITTVRKYAVDHGKGALNGDYKIQSKLVHARDIFTNGDSWLEWGYDPQPYDKEAEVARRERLAAKRTGGAFSQPKSDQTDTPAFKRWFGDSKVVDEKGEPLVVYHGTPQAFTEFRESTDGNLGRGIYLTKDRAAARSYGRNVMSVYAKIENPADFKAVNAINAEVGYDREATRKELERRGYDGIVTNKEIVAFRPEQIKSATGNTGVFDPKNPNILFSQPADTFYSALQRSVEQAKGAPKTGTARQWKEWLDGAQRRGEFKGSERDWLGIDQWLEDRKGPVSRADIEGFIKQNAVNLTDMTYIAPDEMSKAEMERLDALAENYSNLTPEEESEYETLNNRAAYLDAVDAGLPGVARYKTYTIDGGQNYRELMMVLPTEGEQFNNDFHFPGMRNVLTHIRFNERTSADGKPTLHIEEIQSDWHQAGRRKGYGQQPLKREPIDLLRPYEAGEGLWGLEDGRGDRDFDLGTGPGNAYFDSLERAQQAADEANSDAPIANGVPNAPLKQTEDWALLGFKRALRWAAENGFERVTWTTGAQQADRYDLSRQISKLSAQRVMSGDRTEYFIMGWPPEGGPTPSFDKTIPEAELENAVGKEMAAKIKAQGDWIEVYRGLDLKVGGDGMQSFYDQMLPKTVAKYVKKWDGKVGKAEIETGTYVMKGKDEIVPERVTVHSIDITPQMQQSVMQGQPLFSMPAASVDDLGAVLSKPDGGVFQRAKEWAAGKWQDLRPTALGALTLRHVLELAEPLIPGAKQYADTVQRIGADRNVMLEQAGQISDEVQKWAKGGRLFGGYTPEAQALFDLIHKSTIAGSDPSQPYRPMVFGDSQGNPVEYTPEALKERKKQLQAQIRGRPGEAHFDKLEELKFLDKLPDIEKARKAQYPELLAQWQKLTPKAQQYYTRLRDYYENHSREVEKALDKRIQALDVPETHKRAMVENLKRQFELQRLQGVYFPLQRYGEYWVSATDADGEPAYLMFENAKDWARAQKKLRDSGFTINASGRKDQNYRAKDAPSGTFVAQIMEQLQQSHVSEKVQDEIYQLFLKSLPELSMRKHSIHRKATAGFSDDALRAFAKNAFHGAHQLSKLRYSHVLQAQLDAMKVLVENRRQSGLPPAEVNAMDALLGELQRRHDWVLSPTDSKIANYASAIGFINYLASGAAAVINLTQGPMITFPVLGAQHGFDKAARMLTSATKDAVRTFGNIDRVLKTEDERLAFKTLMARGDLQRSAAHNLAGIAEGSQLQANPAWAKVMYAMTYAFQKAEEVNRQAAGIAAFRMAKSAGQSTDEAIAYASEIINGTHYDFSNANRARFMQSAPAKVLLMFRQYALNTTWLLARAVQKAVAGESPEVKRLARRKLAGVLGMSALFSGAMGLPFMGVAGMVVNALQSAFGDDDEPFDFAIEVRNFLADALGPEAARIIADGPVNRLGADFASRVAMNQLWLRDADRELEGQDAYYHLLEQAAGPIGGIGKNVLVGLKQIGEGHVWRGFETMMPKGLKDAMKAIRFEDEGANTLRGDPLIKDVGIGEGLIQALGFSPTRLSEQYRINSAVKNYEQHILNRRQDLLGALALAVRYSDDEARAAALTKIQSFNRKYPELALSAHSIRQSLRVRARYSAQAENGIVLNKRIAARAREEAGGFAGN